jgi:hypothetical protein
MLRTFDRATEAGFVWLMQGDSGVWKEYAVTCANR